MRVAFFVRKFPKLSETFILNQATSLLDGGCTLDIYSSRGEAYEETALESGAGNYDLMANTHFALSVPKSPGARLVTAVRVLKRSGFRHPSVWLESLNVRRLGQDVFGLRELYAVLPLIASPPADVLHCQFGYVGIQWRPYLSRLRAPLVVAIRGADVTEHVWKYGPEIYAPLFRQADLFLPNCEYFANRLADLGCPREKIRVHYSSVDKWA